LFDHLIDPRDRVAVRASREREVPQVERLSVVPQRTAREKADPASV